MFLPKAGLALSPVVYAIEASKEPDLVLVNTRADWL